MYPIHPYARIPLFPRPLPSFYRLKFAVDRSVARPSLYPVLRAGVGNNEGRGEGQYIARRTCRSQIEIR